VRPILEICRLHADLLSGTFNPEIFTASLSQVLDFYRGKKTVIHNLYTDAEQFLTQATYPTDGLRRVLYEVFGRLVGDSAREAPSR
jgi:predicted AAA+ superfamily ATPase